MGTLGFMMLGLLCVFWLITGIVCVINSSLNSGNEGGVLLSLYESLKFRMKTYGDLVLFIPKLSVGIICSIVISLSIIILNPVIFLFFVTQRRSTPYHLLFDHLTQEKRKNTIFGKLSKKIVDFFAKIKTNFWDKELPEFTSKEEKIAKLKAKLKKLEEE